MTWEPPPFRRDVKMTRAGITWYCQLAGISWATAPKGEGGWELFFTDGPEWWLLGPDYSERRAAAKLRPAMDCAAKKIAESGLSD